MKPPTPWQTAIEHTLFPMVLVKDVLGSIVGYPQLAHS